jgi:acetolactate synthase-1/2/3 large subunit
VLIDIPKDITQAVWDFEPKKPDPIVPMVENLRELDIEQALKLIAQCERPLILAGGGVISADASQELVAFRSLLDAPIALSLMGIGGFRSTDPNYTGMIGMHGTKASSFAVSHCDLLIAIGTRFSDRVICNPNHFAPNAKIIHIDVDPAEVNKNVHAFSSIIGDVKEILNRLNSRISPRKHDNWNTQIQDYKKRYPIDHPQGEEVMPQMICEKAWEILGEKGIITTEVGQHQMWAAQFFKMLEPRTFITSGGLGAMGFGLGAAIGAQMANPDKVVVNVAKSAFLDRICWIGSMQSPSNRSA